MKLLRMSVTGLLVFGMLLLPVLIPFASGASGKGKVAFLKDTAAALRQSNPGIASGLEAFADEQNEEIYGEPAGILQTNGNTPGDRIKQREAQVKLLRDAAKAVQMTDQKSAQRLNNWADILERKLNSIDEEDMDAMAETIVPVPENQK